MLSLSTNTITFNSVPPSAPTPVDVTATLTGTGSGTLFILVGTSNPAVANITNVFVTGPTTGQGTVVPGSPGGLGAGSFTATIQVRACLNDSTCASGEVRGSPQTINVTYNITGVRSSAANLTYNIGNSPTAADVTRSFNVTGFPAQSWSVTTNAPWLTLNPPSGNSSASVAVSANLVPTPLDALNSGTFTGNIVLTPTTGLPVTIPVTLNVARTQVNYVSPYVGQSGVGGDVIIRGDNFNLITPTDVRFGANGATAPINVVSNTEIRATHGPLAAGSYDVHIVNNENIDRTRARLLVVDAPTFAQAALPYPDGPGGVILYNLIYDAERRAVFVTMRYGADPPGPASGRLLRWGYNGSTWEPATQKQFLANNAIRLTADGTQLLVAHHDPLFNLFAVAELDPVTLVENRMTRFTQDYEASSMAISSTGEAIIIGDSSFSSGSFPIFGYSPLTGVLRTVTQPGVFSVMDAFAAGSADGSLVLVPSNNDPVLGNQPTLRYDSNTGQLAQNPVSARAFVAPQINRHATRLLFDRLDVRDANLALLGSLPNSTQNAVLDPVELRAYAYETNTVRVYDLGGTPVNGIYPEITPAIPVNNDPGGANFITISPDGGTLFIAGTDQVVVVPLP